MRRTQWTKQPGRRSRRHWERSARSSSHTAGTSNWSIEDDGTVKVQLQGACAGCPGAVMTLRDGVERLLKEAVPAVKEVVAV